MTAFSTAGALGVAVIGLLDAILTGRSGSPLHAFILSTAVVTLLSFGLAFTVRPLSKPLTPSTGVWVYCCICARAVSRIS